MDAPELAAVAAPDHEDAAGTGDLASAQTHQPPAGERRLDQEAARQRHAQSLRRRFEREKGIVEHQAFRRRGVQPHRREPGEANARLADSGVSIAGAARIRFSVDSRGYVSAVRVLRSSGSSEADARIREALQQMHVDAVPADLLGANVMLEVTNEAFADARTP